MNYDFGADKGCLRPDCAPNCENPLPDGSGECDRFLEFWNLVFMTLYQAEDGTRTPLPQRNVDTGAGFERYTAVVAGGADWRGNERLAARCPTNYDTDLGPVLDAIGGIVGKAYEAATRRAARDAHHRRPRPRRDVPHCRGPYAQQRRPRLRSAPPDPAATCAQA
jgi:hypothetical protein